MTIIGKYYQVPYILWKIFTEFFFWFIKTFLIIRLVILLFLPHTHFPMLHTLGIFKKYLNLTKTKRFLIIHIFVEVSNVVTVAADVLNCLFNVVHYVTSTSVYPILQLSVLSRVFAHKTGLEKFRCAVNVLFWELRNNEQLRTSVSLQ